MATITTITRRIAVTLKRRPFMTTVGRSLNISPPRRRIEGVLLKTVSRRGGFCPNFGLPFKITRRRHRVTKRHSRHPENGDQAIKTRICRVTRPGVKRQRERGTILKSPRAKRHLRMKAVPLRRFRHSIIINTNTRRNFVLGQFGNRIIKSPVTNLQPGIQNGDAKTTLPMFCPAPKKT